MNIRVIHRHVSPNKIAVHVCLNDSIGPRGLLRHVVDLILCYGYQEYGFCFIHKTASLSHKYG